MILVARCNCKQIGILENSHYMLVYVSIHDHLYLGENSSHVDEGPDMLIWEQVYVGVEWDTQLCPSPGYMSMRISCMLV